MEKEKQRSHRGIRGQKALAAVLAAAVLGSGALLTERAEAAVSVFRDVPANSWYRLYVTELSQEGIIKGYPDGTFRPANTVTCGQFLAMAMQTADQTQASLQEETAGERDSGSHWARRFYDQAIDREVLFRDELPVTALDRPISREWMAVISCRLLPEKTVSSWEFDGALQGISDLEEQSPHSWEIVTAYTGGLLSGYKDGTFRPEGNLTRAEASTVICKLKGLRQGESTAPEEPQQPQKPEEPQQPEAVSWEKDPADFPAGTLAFHYSMDGGDHRKEMTDRIKGQIEKGGFAELEEMAEEVDKAFQNFYAKAVQPVYREKQGLRKEYICGYPVLMEAMSDGIHIYVKPKGTETTYWEVRPGEVSEEFF